MQVTSTPKKYNVNDMFQLKPEKRKMPKLIDIVRDCNVTLQECVELNVPAYDLQTLYSVGAEILKFASDGRLKKPTPQLIGSLEVFTDTVRVYIDKFADKKCVVTVAFCVTIESLLVTLDQVTRVLEGSIT